MSGRIGLLGGTFDPIHYGHLLAASQAFEHFALDQILFIPAGQPWQKQDRAISSGADRFAMAELATAPDARFAVSRVELDRPGPTYTVDTLAELKSRFGQDVALYFIAGADALRLLGSWRDHERVLELAHVIAVTRPGHELAAGLLPASSVTALPIPQLEISSSDIRRRVAAGRSIDYLVPAAVADYIHQNRLYGDPSVDGTDS